MTLVVLPSRSSTALWEHEFANPDKYKDTVQAAVTAASAAITAALPAVPVVGVALAAVAGPCWRLRGRTSRRRSTAPSASPTITSAPRPCFIQRQADDRARRQDRETPGHTEWGFKAETPLFSSDGATYKAYFGLGPR